MRNSNSMKFYLVCGIAALLLGIGALGIIADGWTELNTIYIVVIGLASVAAVAGCIQDAEKSKAKDAQGPGFQAPPSEVADMALIDAAQSVEELAAIVANWQGNQATMQAAFDRVSDAPAALWLIFDKWRFYSWGEQAVRRLEALGEFTAEQQKLFKKAQRLDPDQWDFWGSLLQIDSERLLLMLIEKLSSDLKEEQCKNALRLLSEKGDAMPAMAERLAAYIVRVEPSEVLELVDRDDVRWWELPQAGFSRPIAELPRNFSGGDRASDRRETLLKGLYRHRPDLRDEILALDGTEFIAEQDGSYYFPGEYVSVCVVGEGVIEVSHSKQRLMSNQGQATAQAASEQEQQPEDNAAEELVTPLGIIRILYGPHFLPTSFIIEELPASAYEGSECLFAVDRRVKLTPNSLDSTPSDPPGHCVRCLLMRPEVHLGLMSGPESGEHYQAMSLYEGGHGEGDTKLTIGCVNYADDYEDFDCDDPMASATENCPPVFSVPFDGDLTVGVELVASMSRKDSIYFIVSWLTSNAIDANDAQHCADGGKDRYTYFASDPYYLESGVRRTTNRTDNC